MLTPEARGPAPPANHDVGMGLTPEAGGLSPRPNPDVDIGLTPEAGRPAPRLNHALTCVVTCGERIFRPLAVVTLSHFSASFSAFCGLFSPSFSVVSHGYESQIRQ